MPVEQNAAWRIGLRESVYLDLVRALASLTVVLDHAASSFHLQELPRWGHQAVVVFFVLSGYVICNVADTRENTMRVFLVARLARLWSVLVPAMALTVLCDLIGRFFGTNPLAYADVPNNLPLIRIGATLTFLSESWVSIQPLSNGVVWSLSVEFWYYILFAAWTFLPRGRVRMIGVTIAAVMSGHKALLLLPIWLMGVALQRSQWLRRADNLGAGPAAGLFIVSLGLILLILTTRFYDAPFGLLQRFVSPWVFEHLAQARVFWFDWIFGLLVLAHLVGARRIVRTWPLERAIRPIRWCAGISFAAYLFHEPLLQLCSGFLPASRGWLAIALTLIAIALLGSPVERTKGWWRRQLTRLAASLGGRPKAKAVQASLRSDF